MVPEVRSRWKQYDGMFSAGELCCHFVACEMLWMTENLRARSLVAETTTDIPWGGFSQCSGVLFAACVLPVVQTSNLVLLPPVPHSFCVLCVY